MYFLLMFLPLSLLPLAYDRIVSKFAFLCFSSVFVAFIFAIRGENYGLDITTYYQIFLDKNYYLLDEPGLTVINLLISFISKEYFWFSIIYSSILTFLCSHLYWKLNRKVALFSFFILISNYIFFQMQLNIYRQGLASLIVLTAFLFYQKKLFLSLFILICACLIHKAALIGGVIILVARIPLNRHVFILLFFFSFIPFGDSLFIFIAKYISNIIPILSYSLTEYARLSQEGLMDASGFDHRNLPVLATLFLLWYWKIELPSSMRYGNVFLWTFILSVFFASIFSSNVLVYDRIILFAQILQPLFFCEILYIKFKQQKLILHLFFLLQLVFTLLIWGPRNFVPEISFLSL